ncbi:ATP-binding cassette domain-containing protein [Phytoactinopolyspora mesophila]|uniref:ATP-binding cassette domain-containing protein n=1 Tax=Phytoactinopolyspora mesophila TaxID=2650750 RepID=A0A7K3M8M4_9ACTN|nr:ABC transporter ATP-binding protein [Phytoactinopolyspora mesophila]NDL59676.1 ATP-binding cassette domain-containing protein [Phytoactinopolyspora mesophila]
MQHRTASAGKIRPGARWDGGKRAGALLEVRDVTKTYRRGVWPRRRSRHVLRGADLELYPGEVVGLVGENGSGKSTLMKIIVGGLRRDSGAIRLAGQVGYCPQEPILYTRLTCDEHFALFGRGYGMTPAEITGASNEIYDALGFGQWAESRVDELSGGTRAKVNLALALLPDRQVLLLDEPYAGFDWDTYQRFWELSALRRAAGRALLIVSHFITDEDRFDRIYDLRDGKAVPR